MSEEPDYGHEVVKSKMKSNLYDKDKVLRYGFYVGLKLIEVSEGNVVLEDKHGNKQDISKRMFEKYAEVLQ